MILVDADVLLIDIKYQNDPRFAKNRLALTTLVATGVTLAVPTQVILEIVGVMSFNIPVADVLKVWPRAQSAYKLRTIPDPAVVADHCGCTPDEILGQMVHKMAAGDAVVAAQIAKYAPGAAAFLTWNVKHFRGNLVIPVLTPEEWLQQQPTAGPTLPTGPTP